MARRICGFLVTMVLTACGSLAHGAVVTHLYTLDNTYADSYGGPSLAPAGGTLNATNYSFGAGQGLSLSSAINATSYSIEMVFQFSSLNNYEKILDFKNLASDAGLYDHSGMLAFYPFGQTPSAVLAANTNEHLVVTRDGSTNLVNTYLNGVQVLSFTDGASNATFTGLNNIVQFFKDDAVTSGTEAGSGLAQWIAIYNGALTASEVADLDPSQPKYGPDDDPVVPEPASLIVWSLIGAAGAGLGVIRRGRERTRWSPQNRQAIARIIAQGRHG